MFPRFVLVLAVFSVVQSICMQPAYATVRRVKPDAPNTPHDGSSWAQAYLDLQDALAAASSGDEIWVAAATYVPSVRTIPTDPRSVTFSLTNGVAIYGGFDGTELIRDERDVQANVTILGGDIGTPMVPTDNCYHVVTANSSDTSPPTILDGFTITSGYASGGSTATRTAGGIYILGTNSSPRIVACTITGNEAVNPLGAGGTGGGIGSTSNGGSPTFVDCLVSSNKAGSSGGGCYLFSPLLATFTRCTFRENITDN